MSKSKKIIPEFMVDNPNDTFIFLMPLKLKPDDEDIGDSYFEVAVKNITKNEHFKTLISPEVFFTNFKLHKAYKSAKLDKKSNKDIKTEKQTHRINTRLSKDQYDVKLGNCLNEKFIGQLLGYKYKYLEEAKKTSCCLIKFGELIHLIDQMQTKKHLINVYKRASTYTLQYLKQIPKEKLKLLLIVAN